MSIEMITIKELLRDPQYREFFTSVPTLPDHYGPENKPWKLLILKPGETTWRSKRFGTYEEAFAGFKKVYKKIDDGAINCPPLTFMPPARKVRLKGKFDKRTKKQLTAIKLWVPKIPGDVEHHTWCGHCRRPTIFRYAIMAPRKMLSGAMSPASDPAMRCIICGASERIVDMRNPANHQQWDTSRLKVNA